MSDRERTEFRPLRESSVWIALMVVLFMLGAGALWWRWAHLQAPVETVQPARPVIQPDEAPDADAASAGPENPIETPPEAALPALADADAQVSAALNELLGRKAVASMLLPDGFVRRAVATVDNLAREQAPASRWPVQASRGKFKVEGGGGPSQMQTQTIAADNSARYTPFVLLAESVDTARAVAFYRRFYPLFQQAYEELGYPKAYFNDRLVTVIDHLLAAPEPQGPIRVRLQEVKTELPVTRPWVNYEFEDPALESLSMGQKIMLRVGPANEKRLKAKLAALRAGVAAAGPR